MKAGVGASCIGLCRVDCAASTRPVKPIQSFLKRLNQKPRRLVEELENYYQIKFQHQDGQRLDGAD